MQTGKSFSSSSTFQVNRAPMIAGAVLVGAGGLIWLAGMIISGSAVVSAGRQWFRDLDVDAGELVKHKWHQTKAATAAGSAAWQQHNGMHHAHA